MDNKLLDLFYGSILHDVGKMVQRSTQQRIKHSKIGADFMRKFEPNKAVLDQVSYHHYQELSQSNVEDDNLAYITYLADNIASGVDRREHDEQVNQQWDAKTNLEDVFNKFGTAPTKRFFQLKELDLNMDKLFPVESKKEFSSAEYGGIVRRLEESLKVMAFTKEYVQSTLNLLEATASFIPSSTNLKEVVDISLYDHLKMTTAFASCIYLYLEERQETNYKQTLFKQAKEFYEKDAFLLVSFDLSGIQDFIYTITSKGAHKQLRSRSFYLEMISEYLADTLLSEMSLSRANLIYSGGGHAYFILPNTTEAKAKIESVEASFNAFFLENYSTALYVSFGYTSFHASQVMKGNTNEVYRKIFKEVSEEVSSKKVSRYSAETIQQLNAGGKKAGRECVICHTVDHLKADEDKCYLCDQLESFSRNVQLGEYFVVNTKKQDGLPVGPHAYLHRTTEQEIKRRQVDGYVYAKNQFNTGENQATHLWIADYNAIESNQFSDYANREWTKVSGEIQGIKRLAVLRCDVDDLGYAFMAGFSHQNKGMYNTFTRTAAFSRSMSMFFKLYINLFAEELKLTIVYAGGDDVFLLGAWDDVLDFAVEFRDYFKKWTHDKLTLSTGIGLFHDKTPINIMARITGDLEEAAKSNGKDSITLFSENHTFKYDTFIEDVYYGKLPIIRDFFDQQDERGKAFIYKLIELIRDRDEKDRIAFARLAYYLARLEATAKDKQLFATFRNNMKDWFDDAEQIRQAELALTLYVYETRKDG